MSELDLYKFEELTKEVNDLSGKVFMLGVLNIIFCIAFILIVVFLVKWIGDEREG